MIYANGNQLYPFQRDGVDFLTSSFGPPHKYLADDCGLGKTVQAAAALVDVLAPSALIITLGTVGVRETWARTLVDWGYCEESDIHIVYKTKEIVPIHSKKVVICSYEGAISKTIFKQLKSKTWGAVLVDEAHQCKTVTSLRSRLILGQTGLASNGYYKWLFSATPMPNGPIEAYTAIAALYPSAISHRSYEQYALDYCDGYTEFNGYATEVHAKGASNIPQFREAIKPFILQRNLRDVFPGIPPLLGKTVYINLGQLGFDKSNTPLGTLQRLIGESKVPQVVEYVLNWVVEHPGENLIIFAYHSEVIRELCELIRVFANTNVIKGGMSSKNKDAIKEWFLNSLGVVLILQISCGGTALDGLQKACNHILYAEPDWSPGKVKQGNGRILRHGQDRVTYVTEIIAEKTIDETKIGSCYNKQIVINQIFETQQENFNVISPQQIDRGLDLFERLIDLMEESSDDAAVTAGKPKRVRRTKAQLAADAAAIAAASTPGVNFVPPAAPLAVVAPPALVPPQQQYQQPAPQVAATNGAAPLSFAKVQEAASNAHARVSTQMEPLNPANATNAANALMSSVVFGLIGQGKRFDELEAVPQIWAQAVHAFETINHQPQQAAPAIGAPAGF